MRTVLAVIAAFIGGGICVFVTEAIGHAIFPPPADTSLDALNAYMKTAPLGAFLFVLLSQSVGAFVGGLIAGLIGKSNLPVLIYGVLALAMAVLNIVLVTHPIWFIAVALILPIPLAIAGGKIGMGFGSKEA